MAALIAASARLGFVLLSKPFVGRVAVC